MQVKFERIFIIALIVAVVIVVGLLIRQERRVEKERLMYYQLQAIRTSINLFKAIEHRNPKDLKELLTLKFSFPGEKEERNFFQCAPNGEGKRLVDPFGNLYVYNNKTGWVKSSTPAYAYW